MRQGPWATWSATTRCCAQPSSRRRPCRWAQLLQAECTTTLKVPTKKDSRQDVGPSLEMVQACVALLCKPCAHLAGAHGGSRMVLHSTA